MKRTVSQPSDASSDEREIYTLKGGSTSQFLLSRTAERQAYFFLPHLRSDMYLLDCGCGPGSITIGLAKVVEPGETVGIDINADDITTAQAYAAEQGVGNVRFETADVYELSFPDASFDAVFSHALLEHLRDPLKALLEMHRVLKPGGVIGVRAPDFEGNLIAPPDPQVLRITELYERLSRHNGGNPRIGKHLQALLREAGFLHIESSASYDCWPTGGGSSLQVQDFPFIAQLIELGWLEHTEWKIIIDAYQAWNDHPDAFNARAFCEAVGWAR